MKIYTIGHSTRSLEEFLDILKFFQIELVIDVRRFPSSKKFPWFNKENMGPELSKHNILFTHFPELGGYRKEGYGTFSQAKEFSQAVNKLIETIDDNNVVILCAERLWWRCHRRYIAKALVERGLDVFHILDTKNVQQHKLKEKEIEEKMKLKIFCDRVRDSPKT
jgi:uncharacterized protein (DUF488 family)